MSSEDLPVLYIKPGCPWCNEVIDFLGSNGIGYREKNVVTDSAAMREMQEISGQTKTPTLDWHGKILADFGVDELVPFLRRQNVKLEDS
jgi:glutaredoxin